LNLEVSQRPEILDLLISLCFSSVEGNRILLFFPNGISPIITKQKPISLKKFLIYSPYNLFIGVKGGRYGDHSFLDKAEKPDIQKLKEILTLIPSLSEMQVRIFNSFVKCMLNLFILGVCEKGS